MGANPSSRGLAPEVPGSDRVLTALREDDSFASLRASQVRFASNDSGVATVDAEDTVRAVEAGATTITAKYRPPHGPRATDRALSRPDASCVLQPACETHGNERRRGEPR